MDPGRHWGDDLEEDLEEDLDLMRTVVNEARVVLGVGEPAHMRPETSGVGSGSA